MSKENIKKTFTNFSKINCSLPNFKEENLSFAKL